jgi:xanthine dehydrogenase accessory factor
MTQNVDPITLAAQLKARGEACALCTVVRTSGSVPRHAGTKMLVNPRGEVLAGTVGGGEMESRVTRAAAQALLSGETALQRFELGDPGKGDPGVCGGVAEVFIEPLLGAPTLLIVGAGHVGRALTHLAGWAGFRVVVADDRADLCTPEQCPGADRYISGDVAAQLDAGVLGPNTYCALVTRGYPLDVALLPKLLAAPLRYIGAMGSERRWLTAAKALAEAGVSQDALKRVRAPIGIELNAETPEEIAISILAEIVALRRAAQP